MLNVNFPGGNYPELRNSSSISRASQRELTDDKHIVLPSLRRFRITHTHTHTHHHDHHHHPLILS